MKPTVALTFDDGPSEWTPPLLDVLAEHNARATFFVLGCHIAGHENILERAVAEGHEIGLHGWDHSRLDDLDDEQVAEQVERSREAVLTACGAQPTLWRSPWHSTPADAAFVIAAAGLTLCGADVDTKDMSRSEFEIARLVIDSLRHGLVVGLHDGAAPNGHNREPSRLATVRATARILQRCRSVTASSLMAVRA